MQEPRCIKYIGALCKFHSKIAASLHLALLHTGIKGEEWARVTLGFVCAEVDAVLFRFVSMFSATFKF
jgi:hypothetical protein